MAKVEITNPDKILFPKDKITKKDLIDYYQRVSSLMLAHLKDRPIVMQRYPNGIQKSGFLQKNISDYFPNWIATASVKRQAAGKGELVLCQNKDTLTYLANQACITPHIWLSKKTKINCPDRIIFDLDPPKGRFDLVKQAAKALREVLEKELKLKTFIMTTGSSGLHVVVPIKPNLEFDEVRAFAKKVAQRVCTQDPKIFTIQPRKNRRAGRVFIDYLRNSYAQHAVAPYAVRAIAGAPIATPVSWTELSRIHPQSFHMKNIRGRIGRSNPWSSFQSSARAIQSAIKKLEKLQEISNAA